VLLVFDGQKTSIACAQKAVERLDTVRAHFLGVILNAVDLNDPNYSYHQTYSEYYQSSTQHEHLTQRSANGHHATPAVLDAFGPEENGQKRFTQNGALSLVFMDRLTEFFTEAVGPIAPLLLRDQIAALGESQLSFPRSRVDELAEGMAAEILDFHARVEFKEKLAEEIRLQEITSLQN
jgi:Mrp family chromosome partitioning ATPase